MTNRQSSVENTEPAIVTAAKERAAANQFDFGKIMHDARTPMQPDKKDERVDRHILPDLEIGRDGRIVPVENVEATARLARFAPTFETKKDLEARLWGNSNVEANM